MKGCIHCRKEMEALRETWNLLDQWQIEGPPVSVKARVMASAREELERVHLPWWSSMRQSFVFQGVLGALGFSMIIYLLFPYAKIINLCASLILRGAFFAYFPKALIYFIIGLFYGLVPISVSAMCFSTRAEKTPLVKGIGLGAIFAAFLVPFFIVQCPEFTSGLIFAVALGMAAGALSGGAGTLWALNRIRMDVS